MTSRDRIRTAVEHKEPDRLPANFECVDYVMEKLQKEYRFGTKEKVLQKFSDFGSTTTNKLTKAFYEAFFYASNSQLFHGFAYQYHL